MTYSASLIWLSIAICVVQCAVFSGLNLAIFSVSKLRLEVAAASGNVDAIRVLDLRKDSNFTLCTIIWGNVVTNVLLTLLSDSVLAGLGAFVFSTIVITIFGEIVPTSVFFTPRLANGIPAQTPAKCLRGVAVSGSKAHGSASQLVARPRGNHTSSGAGLSSASRQARCETEGAEVSKLEAIGALNFLDLDDIPVQKEGELIDPLSIVTLPTINQRPALPKFECEPTDPFFRQLDASRKKWVIIVDDAGHPGWVMDADHFLHDALFNEVALDLEVYWHRPVIVSDANARLCDVMGRMKVKPEHPEDDVIDNDLILIWGEQKRIITGSDILGRLLRGISINEI